MQSYESESSEDQVPPAAVLPDQSQLPTDQPLPHQHKQLIPFTFDSSSKRKQSVGIDQLNSHVWPTQRDRRNRNLKEQR